VTNNFAKDTCPTFSRNGRRIAFTSTRDGNPEIYAMNVDGSAQTRLTTDPAADRRADFSPIGTQIAFESNRNGNYELYSMEVDGSRQTRLTFHTGPDTEASWNPDGSSIAFTSRRMRGSDIGSDIFSLGMKRNGRRQHRRGRRRLTRDHRENCCAAFSPDGTRIAFASPRFVYVRKFNGRRKHTWLGADGVDPAWGSLSEATKAPEPLATVNIFPRGDDVEVQVPNSGMKPVDKRLEIPLHTVIDTGPDKADLEVAIREDVAARRIQISGGPATILQERRAGSSPTEGGAAVLQTTESPPDTVLELEKLNCKPGETPQKNDLEVDTDPPAGPGQARAFGSLVAAEAGALFAGPRTRVRARYHIVGSRGTKWRVINTCKRTTTEVLSGQVRIEETDGDILDVAAPHDHTTLAP
jgi:TolB protein